MKRDGSMSRSGNNSERLEGMRKERELMNKRVTRGEFSKLVNKVNEMFLSISGRQESMYLTMKRMYPEFEEIFSDSTSRWFQWRSRVAEIMKIPTIDGVLLEVNGWNSDKNNPQITVATFPIDWIFNMFGPQSTFSKEDRVNALKELGAPDEIVNKIVGGPPEQV